MKTILCCDRNNFNKVIGGTVTTFSNLFDVLEDYSIVIIDVESDEEVNVISKIKNLFNNVVVICIASSNDLNLTAFIYGCDSLMYKNATNELPVLVGKWKEYLEHKKLINKAYKNIYSGTVSTNG
jgi:hypothetical protein